MAMKADLACEEVHSKSFAPSADAIALFQLELFVLPETKQCNSQQKAI